MSCPNGLKLKFKKDVVICEGFPYVDLENLEEHVISDRRRGTPKSDGKSSSHKNLALKLLGKIKSVRDTPKQKAFVFIQTIHQKMEGFTKHKVKEAHLACKAQVVLGHLSNREMTKLVSNASGITNLPFHALVVANANAVYGKDLGGGGRGKTVSGKQERAWEDGVITAPRNILSQIRSVTLAADVMFVNGTPFMVTISRIRL